MEYISTSTLATNLNIKSIELFDKLKNKGWIERENDKWILTSAGKNKGGETRESSKYGKYIVWPENISLDIDQPQKEKSKFINATVIGQHFEISSRRLNLVLSEFGWMEKDVAGWQISKFGKSIGGKQFEHETSGASYVLWPEEILHNKNLTSLFKEHNTNIEVIQKPTDQKSTKSNSDIFRERFPATLRTKDGHLVRSRAEQLIDNALYDYKVAHAYERLLPISEDVYSDFYIPSEGGGYIEFWGLENDPKYLERKKVKNEIYRKYDFKLIELNDSDVANLDDNLPKKLLKFNIKVY